MWNASAQGAEKLVLEGDDWRARLRSWAIIQREMIDRHPWITQMPMAAPPLAPNSLTFVERGPRGPRRHRAGRRRQAAGDRADQLLHAQRGPDGPRRGPRRAGRDRGRGRGGDGSGPPPGWSFEALLRELVDEQTYPRLHRLAWSAQIGDAPSGFDEREEFLFGVERILDGVQALIDRNAPPAGR